MSQVQASVEQSKAVGLKTFRHSHDVEEFYRFIHENGLRNEAKLLVEKAVEMLKPASLQKKRRGRKKSKLQ